MPGITRQRAISPASTEAGTKVARAGGMLKRTDDGAMEDANARQAARNQASAPEGLPGLPRRLRRLSLGRSRPQGQQEDLRLPRDDEPRRRRTLPGRQAARVGPGRAQLPLRQPDGLQPRQERL